MAAAGTYSVQAIGDDGLRIYIDDTLVASQWPNESNYWIGFNNTVPLQTLPSPKCGSGRASRPFEWV